MILRALDLCCRAGGASKGLADAGFDVTGVDIEDCSDRYPFRFVQADALTFDLAGFDFVWASPPCQAFTAYRRRPGHVKEAVNLIPAMREKLRASGLPHVIENVAGAPLENPVMLCGSMFGLDVRRHRFFETTFEANAPRCEHPKRPRFAQATNRTNKRSTVEIGVWRIPIEVQRAAMGIHWMSREDLSQAIPPVYASFLARAWMRSVGYSALECGA